MEILKQKIIDGEVDIGKDINEKTIVKVSFGIDENGEIQMKHKEVIHRARKRPLQKIREHSFINQTQYMRLNPNEYFENRNEEEACRRLRINKQEKSLMEETFRKLEIYSKIMKDIGTSVYGMTVHA